VSQAGSIRIRSAVAADLAAMELAKREAGLAAWPHILPPEAIAQLPFPDRWANAVHRPPARTAVLVGELNEAVAGFAIIRPSADDDATAEIGELDGFYVAPSAWGRGVGRALLEAALDLMRDQGFDQATLWTAVDNHRPRRIYEFGGWRPDGAVRHRHLGGAEFDELRYRIRL
jgi:GNAT superfamily N-acetyltransferase